MRPDHGERLALKVPNSDSRESETQEDWFQVTPHYWNEPKHSCNLETRLPQRDFKAFLKLTNVTSNNNTSNYCDCFN